MCLCRLLLVPWSILHSLRFRTGCHALPNVIGTRTGVPRSQRLCPLCQSPYSDERHTLLECTALSPLRETYSQLFCPHVRHAAVLCGRMICPSLRDMSLNACNLWQPHNPPASEVVKCRALSGCCVATSLVACPGSSIARELIPLGVGIGGDTAAILIGLKLYNSFPFLHRYITLTGGSHHLISQAGWNRCNLSIYLSSAVVYYLLGGQCSILGAII